MWITYPHFHTLWITWWGFFPTPAEALVDKLPKIVDNFHNLCKTLTSTFSQQRSYPHLDS
jgi:hypothetical protein